MDHSDTASNPGYVAPYPGHQGQRQAASHCTFWGIVSPVNTCFSGVKLHGMDRFLFKYDFKLLRFNCFTGMLTFIDLCVVCVHGLINIIILLFLSFLFVISKSFTFS